MARGGAGHFYRVSNHFCKFIIMMIAYMVPPYGIKWKRIRRIFLKKIPLKDSHHDMQIMSQRDAEDEI